MSGMLEDKPFHKEWKYSSEFVSKFIIFLLLFTFTFSLFALINEVFSPEDEYRNYDIGLFSFITISLAFYLILIIVELKYNIRRMVECSTKHDLVFIVEEIKGRLHRNNIEYREKDRRLYNFVLPRTILILEELNLRIVITKQEGKNKSKINLGPVKEENEKEVMNLIGLITRNWHADVGKPEDFWSPIDWKYFTAFGLPSIAVLWVSYHIFIDGTYSLNNFFSFFIFLLFFLSGLSFFITYWRGERIDFPHDGKIGSAAIVVQELTPVMDLRKVRFHRHLLNTLGSPVYYIDGDRRHEICVDIYFTRNKIQVLMSKNTLDHKDQVEDVLMRLLQKVENDSLLVR